MHIAVTGFRGVPATYGGIEQQCEKVYSRLAARGYRITILARRNYVPAGIRSYKGMQIKPLPTSRKKGLEAFLHTFLAVLYILKLNPDIIHFYAQGPALFSWLPRLLRPRMRIFFTCQGLDWQRKKWSRLASAIIYLGELASVRFPHCRIVVSRQIQTYYRQRHKTRTHYVPNGVDPAPETAKVLPPDLQKRLGIEPQRYFVTVGRLVPEKRWEDIVKAYVRRPFRAKLVIVGDSSATDGYVQGLKRLAGDNPSVIFTGYQYGAALAALFANARAFITASELEGLPLTLLEALSFGLPCIVSDIAPHREILQHIPAFIYPTGNISELAQQLSRLDGMSARRREAIGRQARAMVAEKFSWDDVAGRIGHLYHHSLTKKPSALS